MVVDVHEEFRLRDGNDADGGELLEKDGGAEEHEETDDWVRADPEHHDGAGEWEEERRVAAGIHDRERVGCRTKQRDRRQDR